MSDEQKKRVTICMELYHLRKQNPLLDINTYLRNKYNRTYCEIRSDRDCLDFICSVLDAGGRNIARAQVAGIYEKAARVAYDQGDAKNLISAGKHLADLHKLNEPEQGEDLENSITKLPIVLTQDARKILPNKTYSNERAMDKLRAKWGVKKDVHQDMVDAKARELLAADEGEEDERISTNGNFFGHIYPNRQGQDFDLSSLNASQLAQLQAALNARMAVQQPTEIDDEDELEEEDEE